jgi:hypothetical protein
MAKLLAVINDPAFGWYPKWIELDKSGQPKNLIEDDMLINKIQWSTCIGHKMSCAVIPDKRLFGPQYVLALTTPDFEMKSLCIGRKIMPVI